MKTHIATGRFSQVMYLHALLFVLFCITISGCKQPSILMKPSFMRIGSNVDESSGELTDQRIQFTPDDQHAVAWVSFAQSHGEHTARFKWYNPQGQLVLDSEPILLNPDDQLYEWRSVWSVMPIKDSAASLMPGRWHVLIYLNHKKIGTLYFNIQP